MTIQPVQGFGARNMLRGCWMSRDPRSLGCRSAGRVGDGEEGGVYYKGESGWTRERG